MFKKALATLVAFLIALGLSLSGTSTALAAPGGKGGEKVTVPVCHWTPGQGGKYTLLNVDSSGILGADDARHGSDKDAHASHDNDITPPFDGYQGKNVDRVPGGGSAADFAAAGCATPVSASVTTTAPTCEAPAQLVLGEVPAGVTWGTPSRTSGPGSYSVTATAAKGYTFTDPRESKRTFTGTLAGPLSQNDPKCAPPITTLYGVGLYVYKKLDPTKPAAWENSGLQTLVTTALGRTTKQANTYFGSVDGGQLPAGVCGPGWGYQQDKVTYVGSFTFPTNIQYPVDEIGWPPIYDAKHGNLSDLVTVPDCPPATAEVIVTQPTCEAAATVALGSIENATFGELSRTTGPGTYRVTATADDGFTFADGKKTMTFSDFLPGKLSKKHPDCAPPPPPPCLNESAVSYTYDPATNSGVITVKPGQSPESELCKPFYVTAAAWRYLDDDQWPQRLVDTQKLGKISAPGTYEFGVPVVCGQGDIYASYKANDPTLSPTEYLYGPSDPFQEKFLHQMGFSGPKPTWVVQPLGCNELTGVEPTATQPTCEATGSFTLPEVEHVIWLVNGEETLPGTYGAKPGDVVKVVAVADKGWTIPGGTMGKKSYEWTKKWTFTFENPEESCASLAGSTAVGECVSDAAWISYSVVLTDPYNEATDRTATLTLQGADGESITLPLGTVPESGVLSDRILWPGASVDPVTGEANGWPGWVLVDGEWKTSTDPAHYGWTRSVTSAIIEVNPLLAVALAYPPASPDCADRPPQDPPTLGVFPTAVKLADTCTADGRGVVTLGMVDGVSFFDDVTYAIDGVPATSSTVRLAPGTYVITASPKSPTDGLDGADRWRLTVTGDRTCGDLETLALTGTDSSALLGIAALLGLAGVAAVGASRLRTHRSR